MEEINDDHNENRELDWVYRSIKCQPLEQKKEALEIALSAVQAMSPTTRVFRLKMTPEQKQKLLELAAFNNLDAKTVVEEVLSALPTKGDDLKELITSLELVTAKCLVGGSATSVFNLEAAEFFDNLRRLCWSLWRL